MKVKETKNRSKRRGAGCFFRRFPAVLMSLILMVSLLPATAFAREIPSRKLYVGEKTEISGEITGSGGISQYLRLNAPKPIKIRVDYASNSPERPALKLIFSRLEGRSYCGMSEPVLSGSEPGFDLFLPEGTYRITVMAQGYSEGKFKFSFFSEYHTDTFPETMTRNNDTPETASRITMAQNVEGSFLIGETEPDYYLFHEIASGDVGIDFQCNAYTYGMKGVERASDSYFFVSIFKANGSLIDPYSEFKTVFPGSDSMVVDIEEPGDYVVCVLPGKECIGTYSFSLDQFANTAVKMAPSYCQVGDEIRLYDYNANSFDYVTHMYWESSDPSVVKMLSGTKYQAKNAGKAKISGFGTYRNTSNDNPHFIYTGQVINVEFKDVRRAASGSDSYYYDPVYWAVENGITAGYKDQNGLYSTFGPQKDCTRAQMITFLWRMAGCPEPYTKSAFKDVKESDYYYKAVSWAQEKGITGGYSDGGFHPQTVCTRGQAVTFLYRLAGTPKVTPNSKSTFRDVDPNGNAYYTDAVVWATQKKITGGYSDKTFRPSDNCSRAQMVTFLYRYAN